MGEKYSIFWNETIELSSMPVELTFNHDLKCQPIDVNMEESSHNNGQLDIFQNSKKIGNMFFSINMTKSDKNLTKI